MNETWLIYYVIGVIIFIIIDILLIYYKEDFCKHDEAGFHAFACFIFPLTIIVLIVVGIYRLLNSKNIRVKNIPKVNSIEDIYNRYINIINHDKPYIRYYKVERNCDISHYLNLNNYNIALQHNYNLVIFEIPIIVNDMRAVNVLFEYLRNKCLRSFEHYYIVDYNYEHNVKLISRYDPNNTITLDFYMYIR